jgi:hypothetical protein
MYLAAIKYNTPDANLNKLYTSTSGGVSWSLTSIAAHWIASSLSGTVLVATTSAGV